MKTLLVLIALAMPCMAMADDAGVGSGSGSGSAALVVPTYTVDPSSPVQDVDTARSMEKQFGILWGSMIVLFGIGTFVVKQNDETHWLSKGKTLPYVVGGLGVLGSLLTVKFAGGSYALVVITLIAAVNLVLQKPQPGKQSTAATS